MGCFLCSLPSLEHNHTGFSKGWKRPCDQGAFDPQWTWLGILVFLNAINFRNVKIILFYCSFNIFLLHAYGQGKGAPNWGSEVQVVSALRERPEQSVMCYDVNKTLELRSSMPISLRSGKHSWGILLEQLWRSRSHLGKGGRGVFQSRGNKQPCKNKHSGCRGSMWRSTILKGQEQEGGADTIIASSGMSWTFV